MLKSKNPLFYLLITAILLSTAGCSKDKDSISESNSKAMRKKTISEAMGGQNTEVEESSITSNKNGTVAVVYFGYDSSEITSSGQSTLKDVAKMLKNKNEDVKISLAGHCDSRGTVEYNMALGMKRSVSVQQALKNLGLEKQNLSAVSYGKSKPAVEGENEQAWSQNRRVEVIVK